jgi:hypothetical protein
LQPFFAVIFRKGRKGSAKQSNPNATSRNPDLRQKLPANRVFRTRTYRNSKAPDVFPFAEPAEWGSEDNMKRAIAGILLLVGMGVAPALAWDGDRGLHRDIRHDEAKIAHDRRELHRDLRRGDYEAVRHERRELRREYRDVNGDRRELYRDRY